AGTNLINALVSPELLVITPESGFRSSGTMGGPFNVTWQTLTLTNRSGSLNWSIINTYAWLTVSTTSGTLTAGGPGAVVTASLNAAASNLVADTYTTTLWISNQTSQVAHGRLFSLQVADPLVVSSSSDFVATGPAGDPFNPTSVVFFLTNFSV